MLARKRSAIVIALALAGVMLSSYPAPAPAASRDRWVFRSIRFSYSVAGDQSYAWTLRDFDDEGVCQEGHGDESWRFATRPKTVTMRFGYLRGRLLSLDLPAGLKQPQAPSPGTNTVVRNAEILEYGRGYMGQNTCNNRPMSYTRRPFDCGTRTTSESPRIAMEVNDFSPGGVVGLIGTLARTELFDNCPSGVATVGGGTHPHPLARVGPGASGIVQGVLPVAKLLNRAVRTIRVHVSRSANHPSAPAQGGSGAGNESGIFARTSWTVTFRRLNAG
jgi:hypothetical protein